MLARLSKMRPSPGSPVFASLNGLATLSPLKRGEGFVPTASGSRERAHTDYRRGRHDRPQAGGTAGRGWRTQRAAHRQGDAARRRSTNAGFEFRSSNGNRGGRPVYAGQGGESGRGATRY